MQAKRATWLAIAEPDEDDTLEPWQLKTFDVPGGDDFDPWFDDEEYPLP